jgi:fucose 4-O-acetylase-like acetyltransferase
MTAKKPYITEMQVARGIGILLVTVGHSEPIKWVFPTAFDVIYAFHMPLFFFLSGFFSTRLARVDSLREWAHVVPSRVVPLIIPYFTVSLCYAFLKYFVPQLAVRPVAPGELFLDLLVYPTMNPALFMWFLYTIIILQALTPLMARVNRYAMLVVLLALQVLDLDIHLFGGGLVLHYALFYYLGLIASSQQEEFLHLLRRKALPLIACALFLAGYLLMRNTGVHILGLVTAISGILFVLSVCFCFPRWFPEKTLEILGKYSFTIYLLQYFFIYPVYFLLTALHLRGELIVPFTFAVGITGPLLLVFYLFPHARVISLLISGMERHKTRA